MTASAEHQPKVAKTDEEWRAQLSPEEYAVLRQAGTERPGTGEYVDTKALGGYNCRAGGAAPSGRGPASTWTPRPSASTAAGRAGRSCSGPRPSSTRTAAGRRSGS